jgi:hypothetical protein
VTGRYCVIALALTLAACGGNGGGAGNEAAANAANEAELSGTPEPLNEAESEALANEAAADEAADTNLFGGNAAAGEP